MTKSIVCLKWGDKYSPEYVNILYNMCKRHSSHNFNFICVTDNPKNLNSNIKIEILPNITDVKGWWFKPYVFSRNLNLTGHVLFFDLDLVIFQNFDKLWTCNDSEFYIIRDFIKTTNPKWNRFNSSVFKFVAEKYHWIWDDFEKNKINIIKKNHGDQDYLYTILKDKAKFWPDNWIQSYKWEMRDKNDLVSINKKRNFKSIKNPTINPHTCISVFHGEPNPHECLDPWVTENWR
jgi:hypothetical protein